MTGIEAVLLLGCAHGIALAAVLRRSPRNRRANRYLAILLGALSLLLAEGFVATHGWLTTYPHLIGLTAWVPFLIGPLVFLYVREMTSREPVHEPWWKHFVVTAGFVALLATTFFPRSAAFKLAIANGDVPWTFDVMTAFLLVYGMAYAVAALVRLHRHRAVVQTLYSNLAGVSLRWLFVLVVLDTLVWIVALVIFVLGVTQSLAVPIGSTVTIFVIGYFQLGQGEIFVATPAPAPAPAPALPEPAAPVPAPYHKAKLAEDDASGLEARMRAAMTDDHLYQRAGLTLAELADAVAATTHEVSQVLSTRLGSNFYAFVNEHRVEHVKRGLADSDKPVLDLAFEAGFQSKSTFNAAFRKHTGVTPREFRQRLGR